MKKHLFKLLVVLSLIAVGCRVIRKQQRWFNPNRGSCDSTQYDCKDVNHPERYSQ